MIDTSGDNFDCSIEDPTPSKTPPEPTWNSRDYDIVSFSYIQISGSGNYLFGPYVNKGISLLGSSQIGKIVSGTDLSPNASGPNIGNSFDTIITSGVVTVIETKDGVQVSLNVSSKGNLSPNLWFRDDATVTINGSDPVNMKPIVTIGPIGGFYCFSIMLPKSTVPENCSSFIVQYDTFVSYKNDNYIDAPVWLKPTAIVIDVKNGTSKGQ